MSTFRKGFAPSHVGPYLVESIPDPLLGFRLDAPRDSNRPGAFHEPFGNLLCCESMRGDGKSEVAQLSASSLDSIALALQACRHRVHGGALVSIDEAMIQ